MKKSFFLLIVVAVSVSVFGARAVYFEDFDHYGENVPVFSPGARVIETASGTVVCFEYKSDKPGLAREGFFPVKTPPTAQDWTFAFEFLFGRDAKIPQEFELTLYFGDPAHLKTAKLLVAETGSHFAGGSSLYAPRENDAGFVENLVAGRFLGFNSGVLTVSGREAAFHVFRGGRQVVECRGTLPVGPLVGWNAGFARPEGGELRLDRVCVTDAEMRPYRMGDVQDVLKELVDRPPEPMPTGFGYSLSGPLMIAADLAKENVHFKFRPGAKGNLRIKGEGEGRGSRSRSTADAASLSFGLDRRNESVTVRTRRFENGAFTNKTEKLNFDGEYFIGGPGWFPWIYTRPRLEGRYGEAEKAEFLAAWDRLPKPADRIFDIVLRRLPSGEVEEWIDGNFVQTFTNLPSRVTLSASVPKGGELRVALEQPARGNPYDVTLPIPTNGFSLARCRTHAGVGGMGMSPYLSRSCFDAMPSSCLFSVPNRQYARVRAKVAVNPNASADAVPEIRARLTNFPKAIYNEGRASEAMAESALVTVEPGGVRDIVLDLPVGDIMDLTSLPDAFSARGDRIGQLDFEFLGPTLEKDNHVVSRRSEIDDRRPSSVIVLAATLEANPVQFVAEPFDSHSTYYPSEEAGATIRTHHLRPGGYAVAVTVSDMTGRVRQNETFIVNGDTTRRVVFAPRELGTYAVAYAVRCGREKPFFVHRATFARVTDAPRRAGAASPYFRWTWWGGAHGTSRDFAKTAASMRKLGAVKCILNRQGPQCRGIPETNEAAKALGVYNVQIPYTPPRVKPGETDEDVINRLVAVHKREMAEYPSCRTALIFHECGFHPQAFPRELLGEKTVLTDAEREAQDRAVRDALLSAKAWRRADPKMKLVWGSSIDSICLLGQCFRGGVPRDCIDAVSEETVGYATPPELSSVRPAWLLRDLARAYGYADMPSDIAFEWKTRMTRYFRDEEQMAAWTIRDGLIAHALGYSIVPTGCCTDAADSYAESHWGCGGPFSRWPLAYPRRLAAATATLTSILDGAKFVRHLPTLLPTAYACEFARSDGKTVTALWTARGETKMELTLASNASYDVVEMEGATVRHKPPTTNHQTPTTSLSVGETPRYVVTAKPLAAVKVAEGSRRYPHEAYPGSERAHVVQPLASADEVTLVNARDVRMDEPDEWMNWRRPGNFEIAAVTDEEKGACLELTDRTPLHAQKLMMNYTFLRFSAARPTREGRAPSRPSTLGVWVKGNSSWGRLLFEVTDAEGEVWFATGPGGVCCDTQDWACQAAVNFDGWHFVQFPLTKESPVRVESAGDNEWQWTRDGKGNGKIDCPVRVSGIGYMAPQYAIDIDRAVRVSPSIRLKDVSAF